MKLKSILLATVFTLCIIGLNAQDKYEFGVVKYGMSAGGFKSFRLTVSLGQEPITATEGKIAGVFGEEFSAVNKALSELSDKGWEVYNTNMEGGLWLFYIRKKK